MRECDNFVHSRIFLNYEIFLNLPNYEFYEIFSHLYESERQSNPIDSSKSI